MSSAGKLHGKSVIVTGGGSGIGKAVCQLFAKEGASVGVLDINKETAEETLSQMVVTFGAKHCVIEADVTSAEQVKYAFEKAENELGQKCAILANVAGISRQRYVDVTSEKDFDDMFKINVKGTFLMTKEYLLSLPECKEKGNNERGVIVNMSSIGGKCGLSELAVYGSSKSALLGLTKSIALEYSKHKVRCNAVLPGVTDTPALGKVSKEIIEEYMKTVPMGRFAKPEEVAKACLYLVSDDSSFVNGACLEITGGYGL